ncbi:MAG: cytochrome c oxidase assembly factor 1 family protein [Proteobacteria bacterium]|nr:cytochrome c oxidase assembly factor 1 family protein [Pseudomonadota bacterium]
MPVMMKEAIQPGRGSEPRSESPRPIRPRGVSSRLPFLLFVAIVAGLLMGYRYITGSEPYRMAEDFVRQNAEIRNAVGEVHDCRLWFPFKVDFPDNVPRLHLTLTVRGAKASTNVRVSLIRDRGKWRIIAAFYEDRKGVFRPLLKEEKTPAPVRQ